MKEPFEVQAKHTKEVFKVVQDEHVPGHPNPIHVFIFEGGLRVCAKDLFKYYDIMNLEVYRRSLGLE